jgi:hypothetical protein
MIYRTDHEFVGGFAPPMVEDTPAQVQAPESVLPLSDSPTLFALAEAIESFLAVDPSHRVAYRDGYDEWESLSLVQYHKRMTGSFSCFAASGNTAFIDAITSSVSELQDLDLSVLIELAHQRLSLEPPSGHGALFLLPILFTMHPELFDATLFAQYDHPSFGPLFRWVIGTVLRSPKRDLVTVDFLVDIFLSHLQNPDESSSAVAIAAVHLIALAAAGPNSLTSSNYCAMIRLALPDDRPRNQHVAKVVRQSMKRVTLKDLRRFPAELIANFPDPPALVVDIFARGAVHAPEFLEGWVAEHEKNREVSGRFLREVAGKMPISQLVLFPRDDWRAAKAAAMKANEKPRNWKMGCLVWLVLLIAGFVVSALRKRQ